MENNSKRSPPKASLQHTTPLPRGLFQEGARSMTCSAAPMRARICYQPVTRKGVPFSKIRSSVKLSGLYLVILFSQVKNQAMYFPSGRRVFPEKFMT